MTEINNAFYDQLAGEWWTSTDHMVCFLRYESAIKLDYLQKHSPPLAGKRVLDLGAGAGFLSIPLAELGCEVMAVDLSPGSLQVLKAKAQERGIPSDRISTHVADVTMSHPEWQGAFDLVLAYDVLEHIEEPQKLIYQAFQMLRPGGRFFYHTLNKTWFCWLFYLNLLPSLIRRAPRDLHIHRLNISPDLLKRWLLEIGLMPKEVCGIYAPLWQKGVWELLTTRQVVTPIKFEYTTSLHLGYLGHAEKR